MKARKNIVKTDSKTESKKITNKRSKQIDNIPGSQVIYSSDFLDIAVYDKKLCFQITIHELKEHIQTFDVFEAVAAIISTSKKIEDIWSIPLQLKDFEDIRLGKALYWMSGGNNEWNSCIFYTKPWNECVDVLEDHFTLKITKNFKKCRTLEDVKDLLLKKCSLPLIYDFMLSKDLVK